MKKVMYDKWCRNGMGNRVKRGQGCELGVLWVLMSVFVIGFLCSQGTMGCSKKDGAVKQRVVREVTSYRTCSADERDIKPKDGVTKCPPLNDEEKGYLKELVRYIDKAGLQKGLDSAERHIRQTDSVALKWFMTEQFIDMKMWVKALRWTNHFLCRYPNVKMAWETKLKILVTLLEGPLVPGVSISEVPGGFAVTSGGTKDDKEVKAIKNDALITAEYIVQRWPDNGEMIFEAAKVAKQLKKTKHWNAYAELAYELLPGRVDVLQEFLAALTSAEKWDELKKRAQVATKQWPMNPQIYYALAAGAKGTGDPIAQKQAEAKAAYYSFFLPEFRLVLSQENEKFVAAIQSQEEVVWKGALKTLSTETQTGEERKRNAAILGGAVNRCHCCEEGSKKAKRCKLFVRKLTLLGKEGAKALYLLAHKRRDCWLTTRMVFQGMAQMWKHFEYENIQDLIIKDQHIIHFFDFIGSLAEAHYPGIGHITSMIVLYPKMSKPARLTAIRAHALYFGEHAVSTLKNLLADPLVDRAGGGGRLQAPPSKEELKFAALLCLHAVTGKESYLQEAEKKVKGWQDEEANEFNRSELLCLPQAKESKAYTLFTKWSASDNPKLGIVGKKLLKAISQWNQSYLYKRRYSEKEGLLKKLEKRCTAVPGEQLYVSEDNGGDGPINFKPAAACLVAGKGYAFSQSLDAHKEHATKLYKRGCELKNGEACNFAGIAAGTGEGADKSEEEAAKFYQKGCDLKNWMSCANLGWQYLNGHGISKSVSKAENLFVQSCHNREPLGCHHLGSMYLMARGVEKNIEKAEEYFLRSCNLNYALDCFNLATIHRVGMEPFPKNKKKADKYLKKACKLGLKRACESGE